MTSLPSRNIDLFSARETFSDYLVVDRFLRDLVGMRGLKTAFDRQVVDALVDGPKSMTELTNRLGADQAGAQLLLGILAVSDVVERIGDKFMLTSSFRQALQFRDLLEAKLDFAGFVLLDFIDKFDYLVNDSSRFQGEAQLFRLFDYQKAKNPTVQSYAWTKVWIRLTTSLTRYEAKAALNIYDFGKHKNLLDIGGNSGEFVLRICKAHDDMRATVMDLPVVCEFGHDHILVEPERERIGFLAGSALIDPIPQGYDLICFKSMLHDWPDGDVCLFLQRAAEALDPGGTLLIYERAPLEFTKRSLSIGQLPVLLFSRWYRTEQLYCVQLENLGFKDIKVHYLQLDSPFFIVAAQKPEI